MTITNNGHTVVAVRFRPVGDTEAEAILSPVATRITEVLVTIPVRMIDDTGNVGTKAKLPLVSAAIDTTMIVVEMDVVAETVTIDVDRAIEILTGTQREGMIEIVIIAIDDTAMIVMTKTGIDRVGGAVVVKAMTVTTIEKGDIIAAVGKGSAFLDETVEVAAVLLARGPRGGWLCVGYSR